MHDMLDIDLQDTDLETEIALLAEIIVIASESEASLDTRTLDIVLGVRDPAHAADGPGQRVAGASPRC